MEGSALTPFAWFFMLLSMGAVTALTIYCFYRILTGSGMANPEPEGMTGAGPSARGGPPDPDAAAR